jgi:hypothetical protein
MIVRAGAAGNQSAADWRAAVGANGIAGLALRYSADGQSIRKQVARVVTTPQTTKWQEAHDRFLPFLQFT